jgi:hypothetical protein
MSATIFGMLNSSNYHDLSFVSSFRTMFPSIKRHVSGVYPIRGTRCEWTFSVACLIHLGDTHRQNEMSLRATDSLSPAPRPGIAAPNSESMLLSKSQKRTFE